MIKKKFIKKQKTKKSKKINSKKRKKILVSPKGGSTSSGKKKVSAKGGPAFGWKKIIKKKVIQKKLVSAKGGPASGRKKKVSAKGGPASGWKKVIKKKPSIKKAKIQKIKLKKKFARKKVSAKGGPASGWKKASASQKEPSFLAESFFKAKIKVIGIGGGGSSIVSEISRSLNKATFVIADTDTRSFGKQKGVKYFSFGQQQTHGLGTGLNPDLAREVAEKEKEKIAGLFENQDIVIFIASLGGGVGSGATKVFCEVAKSFGGISFGIFTLPFKFEGSSKYKIASRALRELKKSLNVSITIPNERIFKVIDPNTAITNAFSKVNKQLIEGLESLIDLIYSPGIINIDFADVKAILQGRGSEAFLNTAEASGKDRAEKIVKEILHNQLYQNNNFKPEKVLFNILGGDNLSMLEVDKISKAIAQVNPEAKIIFGISKNNKYKNKIKATLLMTGANAPEEAEKITPLKDGVLEKEKPKTTGADRIKKKKEKDLEKVLDADEKLILPDALMPVFNNTPADSLLRKLSVIEIPEKPKKTIRRSALEIKKTQEIEENKKSLQEKEWEIPAFLRIKK